MMVIFVSQCEKKALNRTRRVLDAFADRIGDNTWQTVITEEGLQAVKKLLRKTASKNTAVSCRWLRSRSRSDLLWVVGNRAKFNELGVVAVNYTDKDVDMYHDNHQWRTLPLITYASVISALFHDFGKATKLFQEKIDPCLKSEKSYEPYRHEWLSLRLFEAFVLSSKHDQIVSDEEWLTRFADADFENIQECTRDDKNTCNKNPLLSLPPFAQLVGWLILSHHRLPLYPSWENKHNNKPLFIDIDKWFENKLSALWNSYKCQNDDEKERLDKNWHFVELPYKSRKWASYASLKVAENKTRIMSKIKSTQNILHEDLFSTHIARLALMMADHYVSSFKIDESNKNIGCYKDKNYKVYANTDYQEDERVYKQQLDQHLVGVAIHAEKICQQLPAFKERMPSLHHNESLSHIISKRKADDEKVKDFEWQNDCIKTAKSIALNTLEQGFFGINMASTGKGKTRANAKVMYTLGQKTGKTRFNVALGLRTLTLQTGKEFKDELSINDEDIYIAVGGIAVKELFEKEHREASIETNDSGSESADDILNSQQSAPYDGKIGKHPLYKWTTKHHEKAKHRLNKLIQPPIVVCTIDHLIPATEGIRGGQQIAPMLRLLSSDLILDEPDDYGLDDLPALCRLVHWTGLLGRRVLLSTATMPPALVYACYDAYKAGWSHYAKTNVADWDGSIQCAWFDEFDADEGLLNGFSEFKNKHNKFVAKRIKKLEKEPAKRKGKIVTIDEHKDKTVYQNVADRIYSSINELHANHHASRNGKNVSIGLVRMANIDPMVAVAKHLLSMDASENTQVHYVVYHSRYPLAVRSYIEEKLDYILKRKDNDRLWEEENGTGNIVHNSEVSNHIFVVLASPVAEVGRDHDYDWAVVEPSSMRSIVQIAGRVLRHRSLDNKELFDRTCFDENNKSQLKSENIHLLNKNIKGLQGKDICFLKPGFESEFRRLEHHDLNDLLKASDYIQISSIPKIAEPKDLDRERKESKFLNELPCVST